MQSVFLQKLIKIIPVVVLALALASGSAWAAETKYKKTRALTPAIGKIIGAVLEKLDPEEGEEKDIEAAIKGLERIKNTSKKTSYDTAVMWNYYAYIYIEQDNHAGARRAYESMLAEPEATEALALLAMYSLAQLYMADEEYERGIKMLQRWFVIKVEPPPSAYALLGQAYFQLKDRPKALSNLLKAITMTEETGGVPRENWYQIVLAIYQDRGDHANMVKYLVVLIQHYPKKIYWKQLAYVYGETKRIGDRLSAFETAYRQDFLDTDTELVTMAQLLMQADVPYKAAVVLDKGFKAGKIPRKYKNVKLLSDYWRAALEYEKAIPVLEAAAKMNEKGEDFNILGNLYMLDEEYKKAERAIKQALQKGKLKEPALAHLTLSQAYAEQEKFPAALKSLGNGISTISKQISQVNRSLSAKNLAVKKKSRFTAQLKKLKKQRKNANNWREYILIEQKRIAATRQLNEDIDRRLRILRERAKAFAVLGS